MSILSPHKNNGKEWPVDQPYIVLDQIRKVFKTSGGEALALDNINIQIKKGEFVSVVGRSGSGKSTLANMITGIDHPTSGTIRVGDVTLNNMQESPMSIWRGNNLGIVFQFFQLLPMLNLVENVMLPMDFCNFHDPAGREKRALDLLDEVGLREQAFQLPAAISGGQQQSTAIARALANDPPILIADEPTGNLDSKTADVVMNLFEDLSKEGKTIIMVTHDDSLANRTNRKLVISDGELISEGISQAFPDLDHSNLLELTHLAKPVQFSPEQARDFLPGESHVMLLTDGELLFDAGKQKDPYRVGPNMYVSGPVSSNIKNITGHSGLVSAMLFPLGQFLENTGLSPDQVPSVIPGKTSLLAKLLKGGRNS